MTIYLEYLGYSVELPVGETVVGRDVGCALRFSNGSVSRRHAKLIRIGESVEVEDLGSTNGTLLNGDVITGRTAIGDGDELGIGLHYLVVRTNADVNEQSTRRLTSFAALSAVKSRPMNPRTVTTPIPLAARDRRRHDRFGVELRLIYTSNELEIEATTRDLSESGVFVSTEVLDPPGTICEVTLMVDLVHRVRVQGIVRRVVDRYQSRDGEEIGLAIEFTNVDASARASIEAAIAKLAG